MSKACDHILKSSFFWIVNTIEQLLTILKCQYRTVWLRTSSSTAAIQATCYKKVLAFKQQTSKANKQELHSNGLFTIVHCLGLSKWVRDYQWGLNFFILDLCLLCNISLKEEWSWNSEIRLLILGFQNPSVSFQASFIILFCTSKTGGSRTRWWTGIQGSAKRNDSEYWFPEMWSIVSKSDDRRLNCNWQLWTNVSIKNWLFLLCDFKLHFRSWNRIGGLSHGRTARRKLPCQGIVSGNSYLPTKGSRGTPIQYISLKFWQVWMHNPQVLGSPTCNPWACLKLCPSFPVWDQFSWIWYELLVPLFSTSHQLSD